MTRRLSIAIAFFCATAVAQEGMWMPQQIPQLAGTLREKGLQIDPQQLADLTGFPMGAIVSLGGCSASLVSPQGLIVTNHHCVYSALQYNSTPQRDLINNGFLARTTAEEIQATPTARVYVTTGIQDATPDILGNISSKLSDHDRFKTMERRQKDMVASCEKPGGLRCQVASFFEGSQFLKITQMEIRDVRLVYAPAGSVGNFGGEIDNWMWPRHTGDFGFYRAWVGKDGRPADFSKDNVPYQPRHWLKVSTGDVDTGDLALTVGYPGVTFRYKTAGEFRFQQERYLPTAIQYRKDLIAILEKQGKGNKNVSIRNATRIRGLANYLKKYEGTLAGFKRGNLIDQRGREEEVIRRQAAADRTALAKLDASMNEIASLNEKVNRTRERDTVLAWLYEASPMLRQANSLYRLSVERNKKDIDRATDFQERDAARLRAGLATAQRSIEPGSDRAGLRHFIQEATKLQADQRIVAVDEALARTGEKDVDRQIDSFLDELYGNTKLGDLQSRQKMFDESTSELLARNDAMIEFVAALRKLGDENLKRDETLKGAMTRLRPQYVAALRQARGGLLAPDANGTLRVSFGQVRGYEPRDGVQYEPFTSVDGILEKETGDDPFNSPNELLSAAGTNQFGPYADPDLGTLPVNFLSTGDITNGSSGSATLNARGELIGLAFDGNYEAMGSDFVVNPDVTRTIHVDSRYMIWIMDRVDRAHNLLREMALPVHF